MLCPVWLSVASRGDRQGGGRWKRVTAFVGSARKKHTYDSARQFLNALQSRGDVESEIVVLSDYNLKTCRGCKACCDKGEEFCPFKDDRNALIDKMMASDGVVFASPAYSFQVSAIMKIFLDRRRAQQEVLREAVAAVLSGPDLRPPHDVQNGSNENPADAGRDVARLHLLP
jgi:NAD(P)H-dependent FMN reductase